MINMNRLVRVILDGDPFAEAGNAVIEFVMHRNLDIAGLGFGPVFRLGLTEGKV